MSIKYPKNSKKKNWCVNYINKPNKSQLMRTLLCAGNRDWDRCEDYGKCYEAITGRKCT